MRPGSAYTQNPTLSDLQVTCIGVGRDARHFCSAAASKACLSCINIVSSDPLQPHAYPICTSTSVPICFAATSSVQQLSKALSPISEKRTCGYSLCSLRNRATLCPARIECTCTTALSSLSPCDLPETDIAWSEIQLHCLCN